MAQNKASAALSYIYPTMPSNKRRLRISTHNQIYHTRSMPKSQVSDRCIAHLAINKVYRTHNTIATEGH